jgi:hypothetical protein
MLRKAARFPWSGLTHILILMVKTGQVSEGHWFLTQVWSGWSKENILSIYSRLILETSQCVCCVVYFLWLDSPRQWKPRPASSLLRILDHTQTHHTRQDFSGRVIGLSQRHLFNKKQHAHVTGMQDPGGIRNRNPIKWGAPDPRLTLRGPWNRRLDSLSDTNRGSGIYTVLEGCKKLL